VIRSQDEMFALAHAMEQEAASKYDDLAEEMRRQHKDDLAVVFVKLADEERAFAFWSYMAAYSEDHAIQKSAEAMAKEELGHVSTLRKERRLAYHGQR